ncbi:hypothetical protein SELMODRAFT_409374 [Selaginella moellendorffii]|uniref:Uncharacterized protein n=1 Tax=Selaginella moellendorffii TaxID=88036 RepID=D8RB91_SELML|nr:hypothetical protein SELMODRAFT_409374 [Selaginella moellendorffii]
MSSSKRRGFNRQSKRPRTRSQGPVRRTAQEIELELYNLDRSGFRLPYDGPELTKPLQGEWGYNELPRHKLYYWTPSEWPSKPAFLSDDEYKRLKEWKRPKVMIPLCTVDDAVPQAIEETIAREDHKNPCLNAKLHGSSTQTRPSLLELVCDLSVFNPIGLWCAQEDPLERPTMPLVKRSRLGIWERVLKKFIPTTRKFLVIRKSRSISKEQSMSCKKHRGYGMYSVE